MILNTQIQKHVADYFKREVSEIKLGTSKDNIGEWDSLEHIKLILSIEEVFKVKFPLNVIPLMTSVKFIQEELEKIKNG